MTTISSRQEALDILNSGTDIWIRKDDNGNPKIIEKPDPNETWLQMDGYFTKSHLQAILFLMDNKE